MNKGYCIICGKMILHGERTLWVKPKRCKTRHFHTECLDKVKQKFDNSQKEIARKE